MTDKTATEVLAAQADSARFIQMLDARRELLHDVDGYVYWCPYAPSGHLSSWMLRAIADELDRRNKVWDAQVSNDLNRLMLQQRRAICDAFTFPKEFFNEGLQGTVEGREAGSGGGNDSTATTTPPAGTETTRD